MNPLECIQSISSMFFSASIIQSHVETVISGLKEVNILIDDALYPCLARSSVVTVSIKYHTWVAVIQEVGFQPQATYECQEMEENGGMFLWSHK